MDKKYKKIQFGNLCRRLFESSSTEEECSKNMKPTSYSSSKDDRDSTRKRQMNSDRDSSRKRQKKSNQVNASQELLINKTGMKKNSSSYINTSSEIGSRAESKKFFSHQSQDITDEDNVLSNTDNFETNVPLGDNLSTTYYSAQTNSVKNYKECNEKPKLVDATTQTDSAQTNSVINYKECNEKPKLVDATTQTDSAQTNSVMNYKECNEKPKLVDATTQTDSAQTNYVINCKECNEKLKLVDVTTRNWDEKWDIYKNIFFGSKSKVYNVCTCKGHKCSCN